MLTSEIAEHIVRETMRRLNRNINIMNIEGTIIASGRPERVGERHDGALEAIRTGRSVVIDSPVGAGKGVQPGVNLPIVFQDRTVGAIGITGEPEDVVEFAELVRMTTELILQRSFLVSLEEGQARLRASVFEEAAKEMPDEAVLLDRLGLLRVEARAPLRICVVRWSETAGEAAGAGAGNPPPFARLLEDLWGARRSVVSLRAERREARIAAFGLGGAAWDNLLARTRDVVSAAASAVRIGASGAAERLEELGALAEEAAFAADRAAHGAIASFAGFEAESVVASAAARKRARFAARTTGRLPAAHRETLQTFFACNRGVQAAADALFVHKNTVVYRLKKIKEATGCDPQSFQDAVALQIALWSEP